MNHVLSAQHSALRQRLMHLLGAVCLLRGQYANYTTDRLLAQMHAVEQGRDTHAEKARRLRLLLQEWQWGMRRVSWGHEEDVLVALCLRVGAHWVQCDYGDGSKK